MPERAETLSPRLVELARRRGRIPALVTALAIVGYLVAQSLLGSLLTFLRFGTDPGAFGPDPFALSALGDLGFHVLPVGIGVFLSLWAIAPVSHELRLPYVLTRGGLATAAGIIVEFVVRVLRDLVLAFQQGQGDLFGAAFPFPVFDGAWFVDAVIGSLMGALIGFVALVPLVLLAVVLLWLWLRANPRDYAVSGLIDDI